MFYQQRSTVCHHSPLSVTLPVCHVMSLLLPLPQLPLPLPLMLMFASHNFALLQSPSQALTHTHFHSLGDKKLPLSLDPEGGQITLTDHHPRREAPPAPPRNCARKPRQEPQRNR